jgi:hypothetical protein
VTPDRQNLFFGSPHGRIRSASVSRLDLGSNLRSISCDDFCCYCYTSSIVVLAVGLGFAFDFL